MPSRRLLIVSPHYPPTDAVDMHRVRMNVRYYYENGWEPTVLCVDPAVAGRLVDESLIRTVPSEVPTRRVGALPEGVMRALGIGDIAVRSFAHLCWAGDEQIKLFRPDLVMFSTTAFLTMPLGVRWQRRFGVPFVLDFQDPWSAAPPTTLAFRRPGLKHRLMRRVHARMEARTVPFASGLISVSEAYIHALRTAYPQIRSVPADTIPFGFASTDLEAAARFGDDCLPFGDLALAEHSVTCAYVGRLGSAMATSLQTFLALLAYARDNALRPLSDLKTCFLGTGYQVSGNPHETAEWVAALRLNDRVVEQPDRVPLLDALKTLSNVDVLVILGSDDLSYQPSKLFQYLSLMKPILCVAPSRGRLAEFVRDLRTVIYIDNDHQSRSAAAHEANERLSDLLALQTSDAYRERTVLADTYSAQALAARECSLFDRALEHWLSPESTRPAE